MEYKEEYISDDKEQIYWASQGMYNEFESILHTEESFLFLE